ncbi:MAG: fibronectin type III domain-containing protein [Clostridia bacterium]|nr:fibronectin type III domain-containing protein [Clostridia bacterium]
MMKRLKKVLSLLLAITMMVSLSQMCIVPALAETSEDERNVLEEMFGESTDAEGNPLTLEAQLQDEERAANLPYHQRTQIMSVREPFYAQTSKRLVNDVVVSNPQYGGIYGYNAPLGEATLSSSDGYSFDQKFSHIELPSGIVSVHGKSYSLELLSVLNAFEGDFDKDGKQDELAYIVGARTKSTSKTGHSDMLLLCVSEPMSSRYLSEDILTIVAVLYEGSPNSDGLKFADKRDWVGRTDMTCIDMNGDGIDEIITAAPTNTVYGSIQSDGFVNNASPFIWYITSQTPETDWNSNSAWSASPYVVNANYPMTNYCSHIGAPGVTVSLSAGDVTDDGYGDVVFAISNINARYFTTTSAYRHNQYNVNLIRGAANLQDIAAANYSTNFSNNLMRMVAANYNSIFGVSTGAPADFMHSGDASHIGVTVTSLDAAHTPSIILAYKDTVHNIPGYTTNKCASIRYHVLCFDYDSGTDSFEIGKMYTGGIVDYYISVTDPSQCAALEVAAVDYGYGWSNESDKTCVASGTIIVNEVATAFKKCLRDNGYEYSSKFVFRMLDMSSEAIASYQNEAAHAGETMYGYKISQSIINTKNEFYDMRSANVTGDSKGFWAHFRNTDYSEDALLYFDLKKGWDDSAIFHQWGDGLYIAMPDLDDDSITLSFVEHIPFWSDPVILHVLASPPYFEALPNTQYTNSSTSISVQKTTSTTETKTTVVTASAYKSNSAEYGSFVKKKVDEEWSASVDTITSEENTTEFTYTAEHGTMGGNDSVMLATIAYDAYHYKMSYPGPNNTMLETDHTIVVPRDGNDSMKTVTLGLGKYNEFREYINARTPEGKAEVLPDLSPVLTHTVGKPATYPDANSITDSTPNILAGSIVAAPESVKFPMGDASTGYSSQSIAMSAASSESTSLAITQTTTLGGGIAFGAEALEGLIGSSGNISDGTGTGETTETGTITSKTETTEYSGLVHGQNESFNISGTGETAGSFSWRLCRYVYQTAKQKFPVITYMIESYTEPTGVIPTGPVTTTSYREVNEFTILSENPGGETFNLSVNAPGVRRPSRTEFVGAPNGMTVLNNVASANTTVSAIIDGSVEPGSYEVYLKVGGVLSNKITVNVIDVPRPVWFENLTGNVDFGDVRYTHENGVSPAEPIEVTIKNIHTSGLGGITAVVGENFEVVSFAPPEVLAADETVTLTVKPKPGLARGVNTGVLTVGNIDSEISVPLSVNIVEPTLPGIPSGCTTYPDTGGIYLGDSVGWGYPSNDGGMPITGYEVTLLDHPDWITQDADGNTVQIWVSVGAESSSYSFDIDDEKLYNAAVRAISDVGTGPAGYQTIGIFNAELPSAPRNLRIIPGNGSATLIWDAPEYTGYNDNYPNITPSQIRYTVAAGAGTAYQDPEHTQYGETDKGVCQYVFTGLTNGMEYRFLVYSCNLLTPGQFSKPASAYAIPSADILTPAVVSSFNAEPGYKKATLTWEAPVYHNNSSDVDYTYEVSKDNGVSWVSVSNALTYTFENLTIDTSYDFAVRARNNAGAGDVLTINKRVISNAPVPRFEPVEFPLGHKDGYWAKAQNGQIVVAWSVTDDESVLGYEISTDGVIWERIEPKRFYNYYHGDLNKYILSGLENEKQYYIYLRAYDSEGSGKEVTDGMPYLPSSKHLLPVRNLTANAGYEKIQLTWDPPTDDGAEYTYYVSQTDYAENTYSWVEAVSGQWFTTGLGDGLRPLNGSQLENGKEYTYSVVAAKKGEDRSVYASASYVSATPDSSAPTTSDAVKNSILHVENTSASFAWEAPENTGNIPLTSYVIEYSGWDGDEYIANRIALPPEITSYTINFSSREEMDDYSFNIIPVNAEGDGAVTSHSTYMPPIYGLQDLVLTEGYSDRTENIWTGYAFEYPDENGQTAIETQDYTYLYDFTLECESTDKITWRMEDTYYEADDGYRELTARECYLEVASGLPVGVYSATLRIRYRSEDSTINEFVYPITVTVTNAPVITAESLPSAVEGIVYNHLPAVSSASPVTWSLTSGTLPGGLTLGTDGMISGIPTATGTYSFTLTAQNAAGSSAKDFSIAVYQTMQDVFKFQINSMTLTGNDLTQQTVITKFSLPESLPETSPILIVAGYNGNKLVVVDKIEITADMISSGEVSVDMDLTGVSILKSMIWGGFETMNPLSNLYPINVMQ